MRDYSKACLAETKEAEAPGGGKVSGPSMDPKSEDVVLALMIGRTVICALLESGKHRSSSQAARESCSVTQVAKNHLVRHTRVATLDGSCVCGDGRLVAMRCGDIHSRKHRRVVRRGADRVVSRSRRIDQRLDGCLRIGFCSVGDVVTVVQRRVTGVRKLELIRRQRSHV